VLAEVGLNLPDYRAAERIFQVLTAGCRSGWQEPMGGQVVLQTYQAGELRHPDRIPA
jgi:primosomal protein N' (replication factor Y)